MNDIPTFDAEKYKVMQEKKEREEKRKTEEFSVVNVDQIKKGKTSTAPKVWHERLIYWILISLAISVVVSLFSLVFENLLYFAVLPPVLAIAIYFVMHFFSRPEGN